MSLWPTPNYPRVETYPKQKDSFIVLAGPCSIESPEQVEEIAAEISQYPITFMRGGVYRAGTYPREEFGLQRDLLFDWKEIAKKHKLDIVVEVLDIRLLDVIDRAADAFQIGARHMQDYALLKEISKTPKTVFLKRNMGAKLDEFLGACEYLLQGSCKPVLIERGSSSYHDHVRWELSVSTIAAIKNKCHVPIIVDASHGSGRRSLVLPLTLSGIAAGADGFLVETHPTPDLSLSDANQAYPLEDFGHIFDKALGIRNIR